MKRSRKIFFLVLAILFTMSVLLAGCGDKTDGQASKSTAEATTITAAEVTKEEPAQLEPVELIYYFGGGQQKDLEAVNAEVNKMLKEKINATVKLNLVDWGGYEQKMNVIIASGDPYDLCFTATWMNNYYQNVAKGAFLAIDELMDKYAPKTKAAIPEKIWSAARVNGKIWGAINYQIMAAGYGFSVQRDLAAKYNFDYKSVNKYEDLGPFLAAVKKGEPDKIPLEYTNTNDIFLSPPFYGMDAIGDLKVPGWMYLNDTNKKVVNQYDTPEFKNLIKVSREWYTKGYYRKDAATTKDISADRKVAKYAAQFPTGLSFDVIDSPKKADGSLPDGTLSGVTGEVKWNDKKLVKPLVTTDRAAATITAISSSSKNPDRAMMLIELMNTDVKLYNTLCWGIEGTHYTKVAENKIQQVADSGYNPQLQWVFGNNLNLWLVGEQDEAFITMWDNLNKTADASPTLGFTFNPEPVKSDIAKCQSVVDEYLSALTSGSVDPDKYQPEFIDKLKKAGVDNVIAEKQKQIDAWIASNK